MKVSISVNPLNKILSKKIKQGTKKAAEHLLKLSSPYVPIETGKLRDSGHLEENQITFQLVWDAEAANGYQYAYKQYTEIFNHKDGRYRSQWVHKALENNQKILTNICIASVESFLKEKP